MGFSKCKELCKSFDDCKFVTYIEKPSSDKQTCRMYRSCDIIRETKNRGTTYSKEEKCPGINIFTSKLRYINFNLFEMSIFDLKLYIHIFLAFDPPYLCDRGQGEHGKAIKEAKICNWTECEKECNNEESCYAFDFKADCKKDTCRLYPKNSPTTANIRTYCKRNGNKG